MAASLPELPHELLFQILEQLDNRTVCALGATCKTLNGVVFPWFFYKHTGKRVLDHSLVLGHRAPSYMLRAIRYSFGSKSIDSLCYNFVLNGGDSNDTWRRLLEDVVDLGTIISKAKRMKELTLSLTQLDLWARSSGPKCSVLAEMRLEQWKQAFVGLLNVIAKHGRGKLSITDGGRFIKLLERRSDPLGMATASDRPRVPFLQHMLRLFGGRRQNIPGVETNERSKAQLAVEPEIASSGLQKIILLSDMPFSPIFLDRTIQLFHQSANTLTDLELMIPFTPSRVWHKVAREVALPHLTGFKIGCPVFIGPDNIRAIDIALFLSAHPRIERLYLHGVEVPAQLSLFPKSKKLILPNLKLLLAHPFYVQWILCTKKPRPDLKHVMLLTENYAISPHLSSKPFDHALLDDALQTIRHSQLSDSTIGYRFTTEDGLNDWFQHHINLPSRFDGPWQKLHIQCAFSVPLIIRAERFDLFVRWVSLFPSVEYLDMGEQVTAWSNTIPSDALEKLYTVAPRLKIVKFNTGTRPICIRPSVESNKVVYFKEI